MSIYPLGQAHIGIRRYTDVKTSATGKVLIVIKLRIDDYPQGNPSRRYPAWGKELLAYIDALDIPYYLAVVPEVCSQRDFEFARSLKNAHLALHGFDHALPLWRPPSEFGGFSCNEILDKITRVTTKLFPGWFPSVFIPPFNMFDQELLTALNLYGGFFTITGGPETFTQMDISDMDFGRLKLIISDGELYTSNGHLPDIIERIKQCPDDKMVVVHLTGDYTI